LNGRYGPYITDKQRNAKIPKDKEPKSLTLEECQALLAAAPVRTFGKWGRKGAKGKNVKAPAAPKAPAAKKRAAADGKSVKLAAKASKAPANKKAPLPRSEAAATKAATKAASKPRVKKGSAKKKV